MSAVRLLGRMVIRLFSIAVLAGLLLGVPYGLVTEIGWPLPRTLPTSVSDLERILTNPVTDDVVVKLLAVAMWLVWFSFAASFLAEVAATIRGVEPRRLPVVAPVQAVAGWLLSGVTAGVIATATLTTTATVPVAPPPAVHAVVDLPDRLDEVERVPVALTAEHEALPEEPPVLCAGEHVLVVDGKRYAYLVQRGDSLWAIAEQCLGDGRKWPEIWELNKGRDFPGVGGSLYDPDLIYPGWDLYLPAGAVPPPGAHEADSADEVEGSPEPPPAPHSPAPPPPAIPPDLDEPGGYPPPAVTDPSPHASPTPQATASPATSGAIDDPQEQTATDNESDDRSPFDVALPMTAVLATAGLLAALVVGRLRRRRGRQLQHRRHGRRITEPDPAAETAVRVAAQPADVERLDHALRALGAALQDRSFDHLPDVVAVWLDLGTLHLLLARPCPDPPEPFVAGVDGMTWVLPADAALPDADGRISPLPVLVTIASQPGGQHLLVDLERAGVLTITGDPERRLDLLRYIASELATSEWADDVEVVLVGFSPEDTEHLIALNEERVRAAASLPDALARVHRRVAANTAALADSGAGDTLTGRINDIVVDAWMPHVLLVADPTVTLANLDAHMQDSVRCAVAVAAAAEQASAWSVRIDPSSKLRVDWLSITDAYAARLPADQLARLAPMLRAARTLLTTEPGEQADGADQVDEPVSPADGDEPWAEGTDEHGHLLHPTSPDHQTEPEQADQAEVPATDPVTSDPVLCVPRPTDGESEPERSSVVDEPIALHDPADNSAAGTGAESSGSWLQPVVAISGSALKPKPAAAPPTRRRRRLPADPDLDADLENWHAPERNRPRIAILGQVAVDAPGQPPADRRRFYSEIVVYLAVRGSRGASSDQLDDALWPERRISYSSRRVAMTKVRRWLGENADGELWLPPNMGADRVYRIRDGYLLDWHLFRRLRARGEARGTAGATDLRRALQFVRGAPLDGADRPYAAGNRNPYTWLPTTGIQPHHLASAVVDVAHQLADLYLEAGDATAARWAVEQAWLADPDRLNDQPWLDLMRITAEEGHTSELCALIDQLVETREVEVPEELSPSTYSVINRMAGELLRG